MTERCEYCDKPMATQHDYDTIAVGSGEHLCWRSWNRHDECAEPPLDWRTRALAVEAELTAMRLAYLDETHCDRDPATVGATDIIGLREAFNEQGELIRGIVNRLGVGHIDEVVPLVEAMRSVVDAAIAWRENHRATAFRLRHAVDSYRARNTP